MVIRYSISRRPPLHLRFRLLVALAVLLLSVVVEIRLWAGSPLLAEAATHYQSLREFAVSITHFLRPV